jgi:hypothetical protein
LATKAKSDPPTNDAESRGEPRRRVLLSGKLVYNTPEMTIDCAVSDLSPSGARVRLEGPEPLKDPIYLIVVRQGVAFLAREAWRDGAVVGLAFTRQFDLANPTGDVPKLVRQIWVEQTREGGPK